VPRWFFGGDDGSGAWSLLVVASALPVVEVRSASGAAKPPAAGWLTVPGKSGGDDAVLHGAGFGGWVPASPVVEVRSAAEPRNPRRPGG
jgi:hypothetical protein